MNHASHRVCVTDLFAPVPPPPLLLCLSYLLAHYTPFTLSLRFISPSLSPQKHYCNSLFPLSLLPNFFFEPFESSVLVTMNP
ncbi:hypothetical protein BDV34DRAFT_206188 [Aspergillus parasiticus]|uniref:Uncharacterized protein n=1 Tax=Aspergillus parasiticus TaxID=5067 RepID=A0A5N6D3A8_ASPPA|nr:hypothetical protein BDV34DRAFT_206188 [Aspergillus parasiticus]